MHMRQKLGYAALGGVLVLALQLAPDVVTSADADSHAGTPVKYVMTVDYPVGGKAAYIEWVKGQVDALQAPAVLQRITSYDNYHGTSPNRVIEMEFASMTDAATYLEDPAVRAVMNDLPNHGVNAAVHVLVKRSDYSKQ
jgi:hypothetical protein